MLEKDKLFNPLQLTSARIARGFTMKELAEKTGLSRQIVSNYESGKTIPKADSILKLINVLNFPKSFFSSEVPELHPSATFFRSLSTATKKSRNMQKERLKYLNEIYKTLVFYVNFPEVKLPKLMEKEVIDITESDIILKAEELRKLWGIDKVSPVNNLIGLAEKNGFIIAEANMVDSKLDAVSRWIVDRPFIMLTDNGESSVRRRFNVAHEIGHLILHNGVESIDDFTPKDLKNILEKQANLFASHFLLPTKAFEDSLLSTSLEFYVDLKKHWEVSIQAMVYKTFHLGLINEDQNLYLNKKISWNKWRSVEPLDNLLTVEKPTLINTVYKMIVENDVVSKNELNLKFSLPRDELEKMIDENIFNSSKDADNVIPLRLVK